MPIFFLQRAFVALCTCQRGVVAQCYPNATTNHKMVLKVGSEPLDLIVIQFKIIDSETVIDLKYSLLILRSRKISKNRALNI